MITRVRQTYRETIPYPIRLLVYNWRNKFRKQAAVKLTLQNPDPSIAQVESNRSELRQEYRRLKNKLARIETYEKHRDDDIFMYFTHLSLRRTIRLSKPLGARTFDLVIAHELLTCGFTGARIAQAVGASRTILDSVEYPHLSGRSAMKRMQQAANDKLGDALMSAWLAGVANQYDHILTSSLGQKNALLEMGINRPIDLMRNCRLASPEVVDDQIRRDCGCKEGDTLVLHCNNVYPHGGAEETIRAFRELPGNFRLCFLGYIRQIEEEVRSLVSKLDLADRVTFLEPVQPSDLVRYSSGADLAIIPLRPSIANHRHCLPNRVFESIAARNPIVAPAAIETGQFAVQHGIGRVFGDFDPATIAGTILEAAHMKSFGLFDEPMRDAARLLTWEHEQKALVDAVEPGDGRRCLYVAAKNIDRNDRVHRVTKTLLDLGYDVTVNAYSEPMPELKHRSITYLTC